MSGFNTSLLHDGVDDYPNGATLVPIYQSSAFKHESAEELERIFDNKAMGFSYTRINNPTIEAFEKRITKLESAIQAGIMPAHLIGMQGPFSQELNEAVIRQFNIGVLVTKESGNNGGYEEKISPALNTGTDCIVIRRPLENDGKKLSEIIAYLEENIDSQC